MEWRDPLGEYEFTCDGCHRGEYPEDYAADATPADAVPLSAPGAVPLSDRSVPA